VLQKIRVMKKTKEKSKIKGNDVKIEKVNSKEKITEKEKQNKKITEKEKQNKKENGESKPNVRTQKSIPKEIKIRKEKPKELTPSQLAKKREESKYSKIQLSDFEFRISATEWSTEFERLIHRVNVDENVLYEKKTNRLGAPLIYGELRPAFIELIVKLTNMNNGDVFYDIGSGIGNVVMQVHAQTGCKAVGVEIRSELHCYAEQIQDILENRGKYFEKGKTKFVNIDATDKSLSFTDASVIFINNYCFSPEVEEGLLDKFQLLLKEGAKVITMRNLCPRYRGNSAKWKKHPFSIFKQPCRIYKSCDNAVSWKPTPLDFYVYTVERDLPLTPIENVTIEITEAVSPQV